MSIYYEGFEVLHESEPIQRQEFMDALVWEDDEGEPITLDVENVCMPEDYFKHCAIYGLADLHVVRGTNGDAFSLCGPEMALTFRDDYEWAFPSAFLIAQLTA